MNQPAVAENESDKGDENSARVSRIATESSTGAAAGAILGTMGATIAGVSSIFASAAIPFIGAVAGTIVVRAIAGAMEKSHAAAQLIRRL